MRTRPVVRLPAPGVVAAVVLIAGSLPRMGAPLWRDEWATWMFSTLGPRDLWAAVQHVDAVFAGYYGVMPALAPTTARWVSLAAMAAATIVLARLVDRLVGPLASLVASLSFALSPMSLHTATTGRSYPLAILGTVVATSLLVRGRVGAGYASVCAGVVACHPFAGVLAVVHVLTRYRAALGWAVAGAVVAPLLVLATRQGAQVAWVQPLSVAQVRDQLGSALGVRGPAAPFPLLVVVGALGVLVVRRPPWWGLAILLALAPPASMATLSVLGRPSFVDRYLVATPVGVALVLGLAAGTLRGRWRALAAAVLVGVPGFVAVLPAPATSFEGHPVVEERLRALLHPGDTIVVHQGPSQGGLAHGYAHYLGDEDWARDRIAALPGGEPAYEARTVVGIGPVHTRPGARGQGPGARGQGPGPEAGGGSGAGGSSVWLVQTYGPTTVDLSALGLGHCTGPVVERIGETSVARLACSVR